MECIKRIISTPDQRPCPDFRESKELKKAENFRPPAAATKGEAVVKLPEPNELHERRLYLAGKLGSLRKTPPRDSTHHQHAESTFVPGLPRIYGAEKRRKLPRSPAADVSRSSQRERQSLKVRKIGARKRTVISQRTLPDDCRCVECIKRIISTPDPPSWADFPKSIELKKAENCKPPAAATKGAAVVKIPGPKKPHQRRLHSGRKSGSLPKTPPIDSTHHQHAESTFMGGLPRIYGAENDEKC